jgi:hypothetical protein
VVETFATCDPAEYDPSTDDQLSIDVWVDADGNRVPTSIITSSPGAEHCEWQSVTFLFYEDRQYGRPNRGIPRGSRPGTGVADTHHRTRRVRLNIGPPSDSPQGFRNP